MIGVAVVSFVVAAARVVLVLLGMATTAFAAHVVVVVVLLIVAVLGVATIEIATAMGGDGCDNVQCEGCGWGGVWWWWLV